MLEKFSIAFFIAAVAWLYYSKPKVAPVGDYTGTGYTAPWYSLYNYPVGFDRTAQSAMPSNAIGLMDAPSYGGTCDACSLFPVTNMQQG